LCTIHQRFSRIGLGFQIRKSISQHDYAVLPSLTTGHTADTTSDKIGDADTP